MIKKLLLSLCLSFIVIASVTSVFGAVGVREDGTYIGAAADVDFSTNVDVSMSGPKAVVTLNNNPTVTGNVTFQSSLVSMGRVSDSSSSLDSSSTRIGNTTVPYCLVRKIVGHAAEATTLNNGSPGQVLTIVVTHGYGGTWTVTPATSQPISTITFTTTKDQVTLLYASDTLGWICIAKEGSATVNWRE